MTKPSEGAMSAAKEIDKTVGDYEKIAKIIDKHMTPTLSPETARALIEALEHAIDCKGRERFSSRPGVTVVVHCNPCEKGRRAITQAKKEMG